MRRKRGERREKEGQKAERDWVLRWALSGLGKSGPGTRVLVLWFGLGSETEVD